MCVVVFFFWGGAKKAERRANSHHLGLPWSDRPIVPVQASYGCAIRKGKL